MFQPQVSVTQGQGLHDIGLHFTSPRSICVFTSYYQHPDSALKL